MKKQKVAVVGLGFIGLAHVEALRRLNNVEIVGLCNRTVRPDILEQTGWDSIYSDYRRMIDEVRPDTVHICTPDREHYPIARYALEHGAHVFCEKPFTVTSVEAEELTALAREKGLVTAINCHNRFYPMVQEMRARQEAGELGRITMATGAYLQDWLLHETDYSWRMDPEAAYPTRVTADIGTHWLDTLEFVTGKHVTEVCAQFSTIYETRCKPEGPALTFSNTQDRSGKKVKVTTEDAAAILWKLENGAIGAVTLSQAFAGRKNELTMSITGTESAFFWNSEMPEQLVVGHRDCPNELVCKAQALNSAAAAAVSGYPNGHVEGYPDAIKYCMKSFYRAIEKAAAGQTGTVGTVGQASGAGDGEGYLHATFEDGLHAVKINEALHQSVITGGWVRVD